MTESLIIFIIGTVARWIIAALLIIITITRSPLAGIVLTDSNTDILIIFSIGTVANWIFTTLIIIIPIITMIFHMIKSIAGETTDI